MIGDILQPTHLLFIFVIALLVLGPKRLPEVGRQLGNGLRDFRAAINGERGERRDEVEQADTESVSAWEPARDTADDHRFAHAAPAPDTADDHRFAHAAPAGTGDELAASEASPSEAPTDART